jgi:hypothetical protein
MAGLGLCLCVTAPVGIYLGNEGKKAGDPQGQAALIVSIVVCTLWAAFGLLYFFAALASV